MISGANDNAEGSISSIFVEQQREEQENRPNNTVISEEYSYGGTLSSFSLGDVEDYLNEETKSIQTDSNISEDDNIGEEEMNLKGLENTFQLEFKGLEKKFQLGLGENTPDRRKR